MYTSSKPFLVIERDAATAAAILEQYPGVLLIADDATKEHTLTEAGIDRAGGLAACLTDDADNLLLCLTARGMRSDMTIVARAAYQESLDKLRRAGADHVMSPIITAGLRIASMLLRPSVVSYLDVATTGADEIALRLEETDIPESSSLVGLSLSEAKIPLRTGLIVMSVRHRSGASPTTHNPGPETGLEAGAGSAGTDSAIAGLRPKGTAVAGRSTASVLSAPMVTFSESTDSPRDSRFWRFELGARPERSH